MARWVRRRDRAGRVLVLANQAPGLLERYGLTRDEADRAAWAVESAVRLEGAAAINRVLRELGVVARTFASAYRLRPVAGVEEAAYRWFASRRSRFHRFGVTPECEEPGTHCT